MTVRRTELDDLNVAFRDVGTGDVLEVAWPLHRRLWPVWQEEMFAADPDRTERARQEFLRTSALGYAGFAHSAVERRDLRPRRTPKTAPSL